MRTVLNLYSGLGGNRKLWADVSVVAVERDPEIGLRVFEAAFQMEHASV